MNNALDRLERLARLKSADAITDAEFEAEKAEILADGLSTRVSVIDWTFIRWTVGPIIVVGILAIIVLLVMPAPPRAIDEPSNKQAALDPRAASDASLQAAPPTGARPSGGSPNPDLSAADQVQVADSSEQGYTEPKRTRGRCLLMVNGRSYIDGQCDISLDRDGSFGISKLTADNMGYFAMISLDGPEAYGFWNGAPDSTHAHDSLGRLTRDGACWSNATAKVCAWP